MHYQRYLFKKWLEEFELWFKPECYLKWKKMKCSNQEKKPLFWTVCIVNSLGTSQLIYNHYGSIFLMLDPLHGKEIESSIFSFMEQRDWIKRDTEIGKQLEGGVGIMILNLIKNKYK